MLKTRIITAVTLLIVLLAILYVNSYPVVAIAAAVFFGAAIWESMRLFGIKLALLAAAMWTLAFLFLAFKPSQPDPVMLFGLCTLIWVVRLVPSLALGLPTQASLANRLLNGIYGIAIMGSFFAILALFRHSALYLFSVLALVWIADIGAYFAGKAFGKRKLAPSISPGKSWEGVVGGWLAVLLAAGLSTLVPALADTFATRLQLGLGWIGFFVVMSLIVAASVVGDLFESQLKRRAGAKDSSHLLPGHGGVLDRIDALIPALPLAVFVNAWL